MSWEKVTRQDSARDQFMQNMKNIGGNEPSTAWLEKLKRRQANGDELLPCQLEMIRRAQQ